MSFIASHALARSQQRPDEDEGRGGGTIEENSDAMAALEAQARAPKGFVAASTRRETDQTRTQEPPVVTTNPDVLDVDLDG